MRSVNISDRFNFEKTLASVLKSDLWAGTYVATAARLATYGRYEAELSRGFPTIFMIHQMIVFTINAFFLLAACQY